MISVNILVLFRLCLKIYVFVYCLLQVNHLSWPLGLCSSFLGGTALPYASLSSHTHVALPRYLMWPFPETGSKWRPPAVEETKPTGSGDDL